MALFCYFALYIVAFFRQIRTGTNLSQFLSTDTVCVRVCVCVCLALLTRQRHVQPTYVILLAHPNSYGCRQPVQIAKVNGRQNVAAAVCTVPLPEAEAQRKAQAEKIRLNASQLQFGLPYDIEKKGSARFRKPDKET